MSISLARRALFGTFLVAAGTVVLLGIIGRAAPAAGYHVFSVRSASMAPTIPVGAIVVAAEHTAPVAGDVASFRLPNDVVVTHRVIEVIDADDGRRMLATQGDANAEPDPALIPAEWVIGKVILDVPFVGYLLTMLAMPIGIAALLSSLGALLTAIWLLEEFEGEPYAGIDAPATAES